MKARELKEMGTEQLQETLSKLNLDLFNYRLTAKTGSLDNPSVIRATRKSIARIKTILTERAKARLAGAE